MQCLLTYEKIPCHATRVRGVSRENSRDEISVSTTEYTVSTYLNTVKDNDGKLWLSIDKIVKIKQVREIVKTRGHPPCIAVG